MIYAKLSDAQSYRGIHPMLDRALALLNEDFLSRVGTETQHIEADALYVTRFDVQTSTDEERLYEYHRRYLDIFTLAEGRERVDVASPEAVSVSAHSGDYWGGTGRVEQSVTLTPGRFLVLFPGDAHRPGMAVDTPEPISRIVFKILL